MNNVESKQLCTICEQVQMEVYNPAGSALKLKVIPITPRTQELNGRIIGIWKNEKLGADLLTPHIETLLEEKIPGIKLTKWVVSFTYFKGKEDVFKKAAQKCNAMVVLLGD